MGSCLTKPDANSRGSVVAPYSSPQAKRGRLRLFCTEVCPFSCQIRMALEYKSIPVQVLWLSADDEKGRSKQLLEYMLPDGKLPILQHDDHTISGSAGEILDYIEATFPKPSLRCNRSTQEWVKFVQDVLSPLLLKALYNGNLLAEQDTAKQLNSAFSKLDAAIAKHGPKGPYFYGDQFSLVDVCLVPFLLLERPLCYFQGISISPACSHLRGYSIRMTSFSSYTPIRMDLDLLHAFVSKALAQSVPPPLASLTILQHYSILGHLDRIVVTIDELIMACKQPSKAVDTLKGSLPMQIKKVSSDYSLLLQLMLEHAQMEEQIIFPALEKADRGLTKSANESHARDLPLMNGIKEDFKAVVALVQGSAGRKEALVTVSTRLRTLQAHNIKHFQEEERELLPLLNPAGVGIKQQTALVEKCVEIMDSVHARLFPFLLAVLQPHHAYRYVYLLQKSLEDGNKAMLGRMVASLKQGEDENASVWALVSDRFPALANLAS